MRGMVPIDPQTRVSQAQYAVVYIPNRNKNRNKNKKKGANSRANKRFPANCVEIKASKEEALQDACSEKYFAAIVIGPSKSSEGQYIYYLGEWL